MKITRRQLLRLIKESMIKPGMPNLGDDSYGKALDLARHSDPEVRQQADQLAGAMGYEGSFSKDIDTYDNPVTYETVNIMTPQGRVEQEVMIPPNLVKGVVDSHQLVIDYDGQGGSETDFIEAAQDIFGHISQEIAPYDVYEYGLKVRGFLAKEYQAAMFAVSEYL